ncbi:3-dehydroquinate synthase [Echinicola vietnamensis]|uniref:3-dehydroquinate synthase n=1 Tax=Echinicola vietnamensis (strain DSM 17526 / LMG 23754 / KMM 6221) TaxID=926556 RepID=L0FTQ3_ECHVK|nr:3-dehydroquinate synthase [Echinicola vietnamensis]AGA76418.1 3-dehydroquinate synthase [Echinicola vietnamensis DSM 17526]
MESIIFSTQIAPDLERFLKSKNFSKLGVITDSNTSQACYPLIREALPLHEHFAFEAGEVNKNLDTCQKIWQWMTDCGFDRKSLIINLGGGVTGDMGGFCASTYKRGVKFINIPTTLLSQVDASVGGKLGVDFNGFKNHIGVFNEPEAVIISAAFLSSLPLPELRSGYAEVLKHGLIRNENYFNSLKLQNWEDQRWTEIIEKSVYIKKDVVTKDPKEDGLRKILNFGHTVGHAVESFYLDTERHLLHGEAIAIGMIAEAYLSQKHIRLPKEELQSITTALLEVFGKVEIPKEDLDAIAQLCFQDKKNDGKTINCSLLKKIGECDYNIAVSLDDIIDSLHFYNNQHS